MHKFIAGEVVDDSVWGAWGLDGPVLWVEASETGESDPWIHKFIICCKIS